VAAIVGVWVCACASDPGFASSDGGAATGFGSGGEPRGTGGVPAVTFGGKTGGGKVGVPSGRFLDLCPESGAGVGVGGAFDSFGGSVGAASAGMVSSGGFATGGALGSAGQGSETSGAAGGVPSGGNAGQPGGEAADGGSGTFVPCPSDPPIALQGLECPGAGLCPYIDGTVCACEACADGYCWECRVRELPFGCPRVPPTPGTSCPWTGVTCDYGDCIEFDRVFAGCCLGTWRVSVTECTTRR
jgi:hypothetical protein